MGQLLSLYMGCGQYLQILNDQSNETTQARDLHLRTQPLGAWTVLPTWRFMDSQDDGRGLK